MMVLEQRLMRIMGELDTALVQCEKRRRWGSRIEGNVPEAIGRARIEVNEAIKAEQRYQATYAS